VDFFSVLPEYPALMTTDEIKHTMQEILQIVDLGRMAYGPALRLQERLVEERQSGSRADTLLLVEHDAVYTLGRNTREENLIASHDFLKAKGIEVFRVGRGGDITYHGPGQLVGYPIINLAGRRLGVVSYVARLEEVICAVLAGFGVVAATDSKKRGVWVGDNKIAAIGVRVTRHVTMHGFSLNVATDLANYSGIIPCGIKDRGITSLDLLSRDATMDRVKIAVVENFARRFQYAGIRRLSQAELTSAGAS
jgi:lipoyl(octanoyl) transferase